MAADIKRTERKHTKHDFVAERLQLDTPTLYTVLDCNVHALKIKDKYL